MRFIVAITGASGSVYALRLLRKLAAAEHHVDLVVSEPACVTLAQEANLKINAHRVEAGAFVDSGAELITVHSPREIGASIASGSVRHEGMVIVPCSMGTLGRIAHGTSEDLISRAADVTLKERRKLILVTREMPLSLIHLRNMVAVTEAGALVCHACPHFYHQPQTVEEVIDTVVDRVLDHLDVENPTHRWKGESL